MTDQDTVVSQEKFDEMLKELEHLKTVRRTEIAENLEYARSLGDLSENAEYQEARELQALPGRIQLLEHEQGELARRLADPQLYRAQADEVQRAKARYAQIEEELMQALERWTDLEGRAS